MENTQNTQSKKRAFFAAVIKYIKFAKIELIIIFSAIVLDLLSKFLVDKYMPLHSRESLIDSFLYFYYVHNYKAAFGSAFGLEKILGAKGVRIFFIAFTFVAVGMFFYFMYILRERGKLVRFSLAMIIGGAVGNLYDRIAFGYVRDFIEIEYFGYNVPYLGYTFAIFNIADSFLTIGMILLIYYLLFKYLRQEKQIENEKEKQVENGTIEHEEKIQVEHEEEIKIENEEGIKIEHEEEIKIEHEEDIQASKTKTDKRDKD